MQTRVLLQHKSSTMPGVSGAVVILSRSFRTMPSQFHLLEKGSQRCAKTGSSQRVISVRSKVEVSAAPAAESTATSKKKIVAVLFKGGEYAKNPKFLGCVENALGLTDFLKEGGHEYIVTDDKEGDGSRLDQELADANVVITTPFHPAYMTAERIKKAKNLELILTAGIGSDHIDLHAAAERSLTVAEVTGSNVVSVAEDEVMRILLLTRNFLPAWQQSASGGWNVAELASRAHDLEAKTVGTVGAGRIGIEVLKRLQPFKLNLLYYARHEVKEAEETGAKWESDLDVFLGKCDTVTINLPLTDKTRGMFDKSKFAKMKRGAYIVNNARGDIMKVDDVVEALKTGQLGGYGGDVWSPQPPPPDHPWRSMPHQAMTPHLSGCTLDAQLRYAAGTKENLERFFEGKPLPEDNVIVAKGELASQYM